MNRIKVGNKYIGLNDPCLVMVDAGVNHNNDPSRAIDLVHKSADAGADVVKFQTYKASNITTKTAPRYWNPKLDTDSGGTQHDTFSRIDDLPIETYAEMKKVAEERNIIFSSTPFNLEDVAFLDDLGMDLFKVSSSDLVYHQLIKEVSKTGKPVILSTGTASIAEMEQAVEIVLKEGNNNIVLQHCMLSYPCDYKDANLKKMVRMQEIFSEIPIGYSDHTYGDEIPAAAVALGAKSIEKHFTLDNSLPDSPDHGFALDPEGLKDMVQRIRRTEEGLGEFVSGPYESEMAAFKLARKSLNSKTKIKKGTVISEEMLTCKRPGTGFYPYDIEKVIGKIAQVEIDEDQTIMPEMIM